MQKCFLATILVLILSGTASAQYISKIKADTVVISSISGNGELIIENSTRNVPGYLYNKGNGRTEFRQVSGLSGWQLAGNSNIAGNQFLGTNDTSALFVKTNSIQRLSFGKTGTFTIGNSDTASFPAFRFFPNGNFLISAPDSNYSTANFLNGGIRFNERMGYLELAGTRNTIKTDGADTIWDETRTAGIFINNGDVSNITGKVKNSIVAAYGVNLPEGKTIYSSTLIGGSTVINERIKHVMITGNDHSIYGEIDNTLVTGNNQHIYQKDRNSIWSGVNNHNNAYTYSSVIGGMQNRTGSAGQLTVGNLLYNRSFAATALGNLNVDFASLPYNPWDSINSLSIQPGYLLFSIGNSQQRTEGKRSNAMTIHYNGRTQINTTGFTNSLSETDVRPKAALEIVSKNSGVLLPKLTTAQRDSIVANDLHAGLLLYNTTPNRFEFYNGASWTGIGEGSAGAIQSLKDSSIIKWDLSKGAVMSVALSGNRTLAISNMTPGAKGKLIIRQDSTGWRTLTLPNNSVINNEFNGTAGLTSSAGGIDIASFEYDGELYYWTIDKGFTSSPKVARFNFNASMQSAPGWVDVSGNPHQAVRSATDWKTGIGVSSMAMSRWRPSGNITSHNTLGRSIANPTFAFETKVTASYWFTGTVTYSTTADCNLEINGLQTGANYNIEILSSRDEFGITQSTHLMRFVCVDNSGESFVNDFNVKNNTSNLVTFYNKTPNSSGKIFLFIGKKNPADANHPFGYINGLRITKL
ncbi:MAG: hypothetical protein ABW007_12820 [Chitinophagaceae bacterium]